jgi:serine/threonine-protein kinase
MARGPSGFNKLVVLKTMRSELFDDETVVEMFLEEARLAARLNHPNIVQTNEVIKAGTQPVIVMEYLEGLAFSVVLERQMPPVSLSGRFSARIYLGKTLRLIDMFG